MEVKNNMGTFKEIYNKQRTITITHEDENGKYQYYEYANEYDNEKFYLAQKPRSKSHCHFDDKKYNIETIRETCITGTAFAFVTSLVKYWSTPKTLWTAPKGFIKDGYALVFLSPFVLAYWVILSILYLPCVVLFSSLQVVASLWTVLFELPASYLNDEKWYMGEGVDRNLKEGN